MKRVFRAVALGGTFDRLHRGHRRLFQKAFQMGELVVIGVTSDEFAHRLGKHPDNPLAVRVKRLEEYLDESFPDRRYEVHSLNDYFGSRVFEEEVEAIVVSEETSVRVGMANKVRESNGLKPLTMIVVKTVLAEDGLPISTTRIKQKMIDEEGRMVRLGLQT